MIRIKIKRSAIGSSIVAVMLGVVLTLANTVSAKNNVINSVHVSGPDICNFFGLPPGCNANFSLVALAFADGSVKGKYTDRFGGGIGFTADINCLFVVGNNAWVSGIITSPGAFVGLPVATRVRDNGTSKNDPPDEISFSFVGDATPCTNMVNYPLIPLLQGQVKVR